MYIYDIYDTELKYYCQRYSNNSKPVFTDQEILTIYLFAGHYQQYFRIKDIHVFAKEYLHSWFPQLPSYQTFNYRLNRLSEAFKIINEQHIQLFRPSACDKEMFLVDSLPIITCRTSHYASGLRPRNDILPFYLLLFYSLFYFLVIAKPARAEAIRKRSICRFLLLLNFCFCIQYIFQIIKLHKG